MPWPRDNLGGFVEKVVLFTRMNLASLPPGSWLFLLRNSDEWIELYNHDKMNVLNLKL